MYRRLAQTRTQYAECIRIERTDGVIFRFTAHDKTLRVWEDDGHMYEYKPAGSFQLTALETQIGLSVSNLDVDGIITDDNITEEDLIAGRFDYANVQLFIAYWSNSQVGILPLRTSWIGDLRVEGVNFRAELRGIAQRLAQVFVEVTTLECRYDFCDVHYTRSYCGKKREDYESNFTVTDVVNRSQFTCNISGGGSLYAYGLCTFTSGPNAGLEMEITHNEGSLLLMFLPFPYDVSIGDTVKLLQGCDKRYFTCKNRFNNIARFGGEPYLAGSDLINSYKLVEFDNGDKGKKSGGLKGMLRK